MSQANVRATEPLVDLKAALGVYGEEALAALASAEMELRRTTRWLHDEQGMYWQSQIKKRREALAMVRAELSRKKLASAHGHGSSHSEQKDKVEEAEKRLREAEVRLQKVKKWIPILQQATMEYHATVRRLEGLVSGEVPRAMAQLERVIDRLEAYLATAPPSGAAAHGQSPRAAEFTSAATGSSAAPPPIPPEPAESSDSPTSPSDDSPPVELDQSAEA